MSTPRVKLDIDASREKLVSLGCGYAAEALEGLLAEAVRNEMPAHVFLATACSSPSWRAGRSGGSRPCSHSTNSTQVTGSTQHIARR